MTEKPRPPNVSRSFKDDIQQYIDKIKANDERFKDIEPKRRGRTTEISLIEQIQQINDYVKTRKKKSKIYMDRDSGMIIID